MDDIYRAQQREQMDREEAIASAANASSVPPLPACGECYNCQSSVPTGLRFCDKPCADDYTARKNAEVRRGLYE